MRPMILPCDWADDPPRFGLVGLRSIEVHERFVVGVGSGSIAIWCGWADAC